MDFDLSGDQVALQEAAASLLDRPVWWERLRARVGPGTVVGTLPGSGSGEVAADHAAGVPAAGYDEQLWEAMAHQGWVGVERPEEEGGLGLGLVEVAVLCEQLGRRVAAVPFASTVLALDALDGAGGAWGSPPSAAPGGSPAGEWAAAVMEGDRVACVAWEAHDGAVSASGGDDEVVLHGTTAPVLYAPSASVAVVATPTAVFGVDLAASGRPMALAAMDRTRELGRLELDGTPARRLGGPAASARLLDRAATLASAEMLGGAARVLEMAVDYAKDRVQFGKPIGSFQAVKHRLADALVDVEGMRSTVYYAAWCAAAGHPDASLAASMAKSWCTDASRRVMAAGLQVHGGIGFTWEHDLHLFVKRAQLDQVSYGDALWHRDRIAAALRDRVARGEPVV